MKRLALAALIALAATAAPLTSMAAARVDLFVGVAPPAPLVERVPPPRHGYVWAPGHWEWNGYRHVWAAGYWVAERPGYAYTAPAWVQSGGGWYLQPERWAPYDGDRYAYQQRYYGGGDRYYYGDGDRYRDRWEHERREHERWEHERWERERHRDDDHDGVPNRYDRSPENPYRR